MAALDLERNVLRILVELQRHGRLSNQELAARVSLSPSPCLRRVRRLEERGYIKRYVALVDADKVGLGLLAYVSIRLDKHVGGSHAPMGEFARSEEHTSELQSLMRISYAVFCLKKKNQERKTQNTYTL